MGKPIATNKKAYRNYFLTKTWECGIALAGGEVKSVRSGGVDFKDSFARVEKEEIFLYNLHISPYKQASYMNEDPDRARKLLLHRGEIRKIDTLVREKNFALVPTKMYFSARGFAKVELALGEGKRQYDKRETIKKRAIDKALKRAVKVRRG